MTSDVRKSQGGLIPSLPVFTSVSDSAIMVPMLVDSLIELIVAMIRTLLIEEFVERVRKLRPERRVNGMSAVRRHVQHANRSRLLNRLSTEGP